MAKPYKHGNGRLVHRGPGGRFRKSKWEDHGVSSAAVNINAVTYICNVCEREFTPILISGVCCGVDNKRVKPK